MTWTTHFSRNSKFCPAWRLPLTHHRHYAKFFSNITRLTFPAAGGEKDTIMSCTLMLWMRKLKTEIHASSLATVVVISVKDLSPGCGCPALSHLSIASLLPTLKVYQVSCGSQWPPHPFASRTPGCLSGSGHSLVLSVMPQVALSAAAASYIVPVHTVLGPLPCLATEQITLNSKALEIQSPLQYPTDIRLRHSLITKFPSNHTLLCSWLVHPCQNEFASSFGCSLSFGESIL